jgi:PAS domain S-box-containing protein
MIDRVISIAGRRVWLNEEREAMRAADESSRPDWVWAGGGTEDETERPFELSIIRAEDNVRVALVLLLLPVGYAAPDLLTIPSAYSAGLMIGALLSIWARLRRRGSLSGGATIVVLGDLAWMSLVILGTGGLASPFSALLIVPILYSVALFGRMRYAVSFVTAMVVLIFLTLGVSGSLEAWTLVGLLLAVMALAWVARGICQVLERERRTNELVIRNMSEGILLLDCDRCVVVANRQFQRLTGVSVLEIVGGRAEDLAADARFEPLDEVLQDVAAPVEGPTTIAREVSMELAEPRDLRVTTERCVGPGGERVGYVVIVQDVTPIKSVMRVKEAGLSMLTHEIRSPLTTLRVTASMLSALSDSVSDEKVNRFAEILDAETQRLVWIAGELLNASYLEDPDCDLERESCDIAALVRRVRRVVSLRAREKQITVGGEQSADLGELSVDSKRLQSAVHRLCDNALKYTEPGGTIGVSAHRENGELCIAVSDNGNGIPDDKLDLIFEKFSQIEDDSDRERSERGTGLGLYVVDRIVSMHGGTLDVDSEVGSGSTFTIRLPVPSTEEEASDTAPSDVASASEDPALAAK